MKLSRILAVALVSIFTFVTINLNVASAAGVYKISCKNNAYGMHLGSDYTDTAYVYNATIIGTATGVESTNYLITSEFNQAYAGNDCLYAGSADTNGTAVVAGDVARMAVNAIIGAVSNRIDMAYASQNTGASATGLSFTTHSDGGAMSANRIIGGLSFWADYGSNNFENNQAFSNVRLDSMNFDGDASSYSIGMDKTFGKALVGVVVSGVSTDLKTTFNDGTYKQDIDTMGVYLAYRTKYLQIDLGGGTGDSDIDTTRRDLGNDSIIIGKTTAEIEYSNARIAGNFTRGRYSIVPSASYRKMGMDIAAFTDVRPDENQSLVSGNFLLFTTGNEGNGATSGLTALDDQIAATSIETETMAIGIKLSANLGKLVPYLDLSYESEDTTRAVYKVEQGTDENDTELAGTNYSSSMRIGGGINFMLGSHFNGGVRAGMISGRDDWEENYFAGNISLGF